MLRSERNGHEKRRVSQGEKLMRSNIPRTTRYKQDVGFRSQRTCCIRRTLITGRRDQEIVERQLRNLHKEPIAERSRDVRKMALARRCLEWICRIYGVTFLEHRREVLSYRLLRRGVEAGLTRCLEVSYLDDFVVCLHCQILYKELVRASICPQDSNLISYYVSAPTVFPRLGT